VVGNGTILRNLKVEAETTCKGPTKAQDVKIEVPALISHAKIAPDGTVFGVTKTKGPEEWTVTVTGSIFQGRLRASGLQSRGCPALDALAEDSQALRKGICSPAGDFEFLVQFQ